MDSQIKPLIGVVPLWDAARESVWMLPGYLEGIARAGGIPLVLPLRADDTDLRRLADSLDGFLLTGGQDIDPARYGQAPRPACGEMCPARDELEWRLLDLVLERDKPVLGICRGIQLLNAYCGGTLWQHLPDEWESPLNHQQRPPYDKPVHAVRVHPGSLLHRVLSAQALPVNSYHHQGVRELAPGLRACAHAEDSLVEGVEMPGRRFVLAVQWHPEFMPEREDSRALFSALVGACGEKGA